MRRTRIYEDNDKNKILKIYGLITNSDEDNNFKYHLLYKSDSDKENNDGTVLKNNSSSNNEDFDKKCYNDENIKKNDIKEYKSDGKTFFK